MSALGNAQGNKHPPSQNRPERASEFTLLPLQGAVCTSTLSQGVALGWYRIAPSGHLPDKKLVVLVSVNQPALDIHDRVLLLSSRQPSWQAILHKEDARPCGRASIIYKVLILILR